MNPIRRFLLLAVALLTSAGMAAQSNGSNSSYSRFGLGTLNDQSQGPNRAMAGVAQGMRQGDKVNMLNPASYAAIDSLTFIFDVGMGLQYGRLSGGGTSVNAFNASLEYVNAGFRMKRGLGLSIGFVPYSTIGYNFNTTTRVGSSYTSSQAITTKTTYYGNGGLHEMYIGMGWNPFAGLNIGANIGYLWGDYDHSLAQNFYEGSATSSSTNYNTQNEVWNSNLRTYKLDIGVQYPIQLNKENRLTLGATTSIGHNIKSKVTLKRYTSQGDTLQSTETKAFDMPYTISAGASWQHKERLTLAADYSLERWAGCKVPVSQVNTNNIRIATDQYLNRHRMAVGAEYIRDPLGRKYRQRIYYRVGASYSTPYVKVNGHDGPKEYGLTAGVALPLSIRGKSLVNASLEWKHRAMGSSGQISENYLMLHLGVTFNEAWFMKLKFQ